MTYEGKEKERREERERKIERKCSDIREWNKLKQAGGG